LRRTSFRLLLAVQLICLLLITGCFPIALRPWYTEADLEFDPTFIGVQTHEDGSKDEWTQKSEFVYRVVHTDREAKKTMVYDARLFRVNGVRFLDISPVTLPEVGAEVATMPLVNGHIVWRVRKSWKDGKDWAAPLDLTWLEKHLKANPRVIRHEFITEKIEGQEEPQRTLVLTDSTENLQRFLMQCTRTPGAFPKTP
jgi:hypothetical protein